MKTILALLISLLMLSCITDTAPPGKTSVVTPTVTAPINTRPATDSAARMSQSVDAVESRAVTTTEVLEKASKSATEALNLSNDNTTMRSALNKVVSSLSAARSSNGELLKELSTLKTERDNLNASLMDLTSSIAGKEAEVTGLRLAAQQANKDLSSSAATIDKLNKSNASLLKTSASAGVYRAWVIGAVAILILIITIKSALKFYRVPIP